MEALDMTTFQTMFGGPPNPVLYRDSAQASQAARNRYRDLENDFVGVKAKFNSDGSNSINWAELTPLQAVYLLQAQRAAIKLRTRVDVAFFNWDKSPIRACCLDIRTLGGSSNLSLREPRPWLLPLKEGQSPEQFDKTIISEVSQAVDRGVGFQFFDMSIFPASVQKKNQENLEKQIEDQQAGIADLPNV
jgi:hypothetical protein